MNQVLTSSLRFHPVSRPFALSVRANRAGRFKGQRRSFGIWAWFATCNDKCLNGLARLVFASGRAVERARPSFLPALVLGLLVGALGTGEVLADPLLLFPLVCAVALLALSGRLGRIAAYVAGFGAAVTQAALTIFTSQGPASVDHQTVGSALVGFLAIALATRSVLGAERLGRTVRTQTELLNHGCDAIFMEDATGRITFWSEGAERLYGWSRAEALGKGALDLLQTASAASVRAGQRRIAPSDHCTETVVRVARGGATLLLRCRRATERNSDGQVSTILDSSSDISVEHLLSVELDQARTQLSHVTRLSTLGEIAASIAHEVNQPLSAMLTNGEACLRWLARDPIDPAAVRFSVERMIENGRRASAIIARLRSLCAHSIPRPTQVALNDLVTETLTLVAGEISETRVDLDLDLALDTAHVRADHVELQQVLINLVVNALQALKSVERPRRLTIRTSAGDSAGGVVLEVMDNGPGLGAEPTERLFDAFYTTKTNGMGMGLSISRSIVERHGGMIVAGNCDGGPGACFRITLKTDQSVDIAA